MRAMMKIFKHEGSREFKSVKTVLAIFCAALQPPSASLIAAALEDEMGKTAVVDLFLTTLSILFYLKVDADSSQIALSPTTEWGYAVISLTPEFSGLAKWLTSTAPERMGKEFWIDASIGHNFLCALYLKYCGNKSVGTWVVMLFCSFFPAYECVDYYVFITYAMIGLLVSTLRSLLLNHLNTFSSLFCTHLSSTNFHSYVTEVVHININEHFVSAYASTLHRPSPLPVPQSTSTSTPHLPLNFFVPILLQIPPLSTIICTFITLTIAITITITITISISINLTIHYHHSCRASLAGIFESKRSVPPKESFTWPTTAYRTNKKN